VREVAAQDAEQERERALGDLRGQVASLAMAAAQRLIGESMDEAQQHRAIQDFFTGLTNNQLRALEGENGADVDAEVVSALPLTEDEKAKVRQVVLSKTGSASTVTFRVDPSILGGLVIRVGDKVLDGSVSGKLETMRQNLS
jgi:F-type H+-transporting ATPase subunit b